MRELANKVGLLFILLDNFLAVEYKGIDLRTQYIFYLLFILFYLLINRTLLFNKRYLINLSFLVFILSMVPLLKGSEFTYFIKQLVLIAFNLIFAYVLISSYKFNLEKLFKDYIQLIYVASLVGLLQAISLAISFKYGADYSYLGFEMRNFEMTYTRIQSWFEEPAAMAVAFLPVIFVCIARFFNLTEMISLRKAIFITLMFLLAQSTIGFIGFLAGLVIVVTSKYSVFRNPHYVTASFMVFLFVAFGFYHIPLVKIRIDDTFELFFDDRISGDDIDNTNLSTYAMYSNFKVTQATFIDNPLFGTGLGTHEFDYDKYINVVVPASTFREEWQLNKKDADSLLLRLISESGIFGLVLLAWFLTANRIKLNLKIQSTIQINYWVINNSFLILLVARLSRQGHYTMLGFMLFTLIYFYSKRRYEAMEGERKPNLINEYV